MQSKYQEVLTRLNTIFDLCKQVDTQKRTLGERELQILQQDNAYPIYLLSYLMAQSAPDPEFYLRASLEFKRWIEQNWVSFSELKPLFTWLSNRQNQICKILNFPKCTSKSKRKSWDSLWLFLRSFLCNSEKAFSSSPSTNFLNDGRILLLLSSIISTLSKSRAKLTTEFSKYSESWPISKPSPYQTAHLFIFLMAHRYEYSVRSDPLWEEIILVAETTLNHLLAFTKVEFTNQLWVTYLT